MFTQPPPPPCVEAHLRPEDAYQDDRKVRAANIRRNSYTLKGSVIRALKKAYANHLATHGRARCNWSSSAHRTVIFHSGSRVSAAMPAVDAKQRFYKLADEWSTETMHISSASDLINDRHYQEIIGLGWDVVPYLLTDLQQNKRFWFPALAAITGVRPFDPSEINNPRRMTEAWVKWGKWKGLI